MYLCFLGVDYQIRRKFTLLSDDNMEKHSKTSRWAGAGLKESFFEWKSWVKNKLRRRRDFFKHLN